MTPDQLVPAPFSIEVISNHRVKLTGPEYEKLAVAVYQHTLETPYQTLGVTETAKRQRAENKPMAEIRLAEALIGYPRSEVTVGAFPSILYQGEQHRLEYELYWIGKVKRLEIFTHSGAIADEKTLTATAENIGQLAAGTLPPIDLESLREKYAQYMAIRSFLYGLWRDDPLNVDRSRVLDISETVWTLTHLENPSSHQDYIHDSLELILKGWHVPRTVLEEAWNKSGGNPEELKKFLAKPDKSNR